MHVSYDEYMFGKGFIKTYLSGMIRAAAVAVLVLMQFALIFLMAVGLARYGLLLYIFVDIVCIFAVTGIVNDRASNSFKLGWMVIIAVLPIAGLIMYLLWGRPEGTKKIRSRHLSYLNNAKRFNRPDQAAFERFAGDFHEYKGLAGLAQNYGFPIAEGSGLRYFDSGEIAFETLIEDLEHAEKFIFLSFFIVADGILWQRIKPILLKKAAAGVEIRFSYDDFGSMLRTDDQFWSELEEAGIKTARFNRITRYLNRLYLNYRNHQKIVVIDGDIGYTGGFNLADEYVNAIERFGHWKDGGIRITGPGVWGLTTTFIGMWDMIVHDMEQDVDRYRPTADPHREHSYCQIISDGPENNPDNPINDTITAFCAGAHDFLYISTPYLVIEDSLGDTLIRAAKSGIDVRIVTPGIPDKKMVNLLTKYNYGRLLEGGVRVYEYTPGFIHIKNLITRDCGIIGTINLDYRSLFLHYECGAMVWDREFIAEAEADFHRIFECSREITFEEWKKRPKWDKIRQWVLNLFASEV
jgi:cardiolipin synthase